jgi:hypothetical protein
MSIEDIEMHTEGQVVGRRNLRLGLWAGMRLGLRGDRLARYARDVMDADDRMPGPHDVAQKIADDFEEHGVDFPTDMIMMEIQRIERQVRAELMATD